MRYFLHFSILIYFGHNPLALSAQATAEDSIRSMHHKYVESWLKSDERGVLELFEADAVITPSGKAPIKGIDAIRNFWFPKDTSVTTIHEFKNDILSFSQDGAIASTSQKTFLSWSYVKGNFKMAKDQWGYAMTVYRRQPDGTWKIWRQLWTDVRSVNK